MKPLYLIELFQRFTPLFSAFGSVSSCLMRRMIGGRGTICVHDVMTGIHGD